MAVYRAGQGGGETFITYTAVTPEGVSFYGDPLQDQFDRYAMAADVLTGRASYPGLLPGEPQRQEALDTFVTVKALAAGIHQLGQATGQPRLCVAEPQAEPRGLLAAAPGEAVRIQAPLAIEALKEER